MSAPHLHWSPSAADFTQHQLSHVTSFWRQGRAAEFRLKALPSGRAELCLTFELPPPSESIPPPALSNPPRSFVKSPLPHGSGADSTAKSFSPRKNSSRQRKSYRRSVLHRASLTASSLPPPKNGSLRQAALVCVQRLKADSALSVKTPSERKRPLPGTAPVLSPPNCSPLAQRIRLDLQLGASEVNSPEREEGLRSQFSTENSPSPISPPNGRGFPPPAPLVFTPSKTNDEIETPVKAVEEVKSLEVEQVLEAADRITCWNCDDEMLPDHQCEGGSSVFPVTSEGAVVGSKLPPLPLCHYCCHRGSGEHPVHYYPQCLCLDKKCSCQCYCTNEQLDHRKKLFPNFYRDMVHVDSKDWLKAKAAAEARVEKHYGHRPCDSDNCVTPFSRICEVILWIPLHPTVVV